MVAFTRTLAPIAAPFDAIPLSMNLIQ